MNAPDFAFDYPELAEVARHILSLRVAAGLQAVEAGKVTRDALDQSLAPFRAAVMITQAVLERTALPPLPCDHDALAEAFTRLAAAGSSHGPRWAQQWGKSYPACIEALAWHMHPRSPGYPPRMIEIHQTNTALRAKYQGAAIKEAA